ncbi:MULTISPECIES: LLM class flavin-dependent oxidoreductase [unclassified Pantoea]|uniref:LLM class flavin-dependent oxidoreductase n=1 Tax=unclassified Pantoea TaxID=2630326 RepID=UPI001CD549B8|nr:MULTISPECIES: LLM class flavin-dependent oxidoreductase [unclassified Pantoea]MCA1179705.1 LLM class flavin-dependent oxidoreductase [Pantoea sp. alder69]MCA1252300.1 LLM class flavin-dependent oxidoreductase [Pantoea sp. alder70]MCA1268048.1 LLM class flavin-dependent oxidoreductase [Pantoea sp. alder81]
MSQQFHLAGFMMASAVTHSHAMWRHPRSNTDFLSARYYQDVARAAERGFFDFVFFADVLAVPGRYNSEIRQAVEQGVQSVATLDPSYVVMAMAAVTRHLGFGITRSTTYYNPYDIARAFATLDHLTEGRIAWNVVTSNADAEAQNFGFAHHLEHAQRYNRADEFLEATCKLWGSWEPDALILDKQGRFADPDKVHVVNHQGEWFNTRGPLTVPASPQRRPAIMQAGSSARGKDFAARWAEIIFEIDPTPEGRKAYYQDVKARTAAAGRDPNSLKIFPSFIPFVGETESIAREKQRYHNELADPIAGLITLSAHVDHDFSGYALDEQLQNVDVGGNTGLFDVARRITAQDNLTLRDLGKLYAQGVLLPQLVGTPQQIADQLEASFDNGEADGFIVSAAYLPGTFDEFSDFVVPELQRRGRVRQRYENTRLRDHLGLPEVSLREYLR